MSVLTIFQAEVLGLKGEALHDAGLAGLLHDMGKLFVPKEIIEKQSMLDEHEWSAIKLHPTYGAIYLSQLPEVPKGAVVAAYEHHMKYDGSGYPQYGLFNKKQHIFSQIVAISDFFDALRSRRPYRGSVDTKSILEMLKKGSGVDFNPFLVDHFTEMLQTAGAGTQGAAADSRKEKMEHSK